MAAASASKYGTDPRSFMQRKRPLRWLRRRREMPPGLLPEPGTIGSLTSLEDFNTVLSATPRDTFVCIKFSRKNCTPCELTRQDFAEQAAAHSGDGLFFEVWFEEAKPLIVACGVRAAPSAHIYARGVRGPPLRRHCARAAALIVMPPTM